MRTSIQTPKFYFQPRQYVFHIGSVSDAARLSALLTHPAVKVYLFGALDADDHTGELMAGLPALDDDVRRIQAEYAGNLAGLIASAAPVEAPVEADQAAILAIACSLKAAGLKMNKAEDTPGVITNSYSGFDEFMRECMRIAVAFETWCCANADFDNYTSMWVYELDDFAAELIDLRGEAILRDLDSVKEDIFPLLAARFELTLK